MAPISLALSLIPLALISLSLFPNPIAAAEIMTSGPTAHITQACDGSPHLDLCKEVLSSADGADKSDMKGLVFIALKATLKNASDTSVGIKMWLNDSVLEPEIDDDLITCGKVYGDVTEQIEASVNALVSGKLDDAEKMVWATLADIDTCEDLVRGGPSHAGELAKKSETLRFLCDVSLGILEHLKNT